MMKLKATSPEARSEDLFARNIEKLQSMFPELVTEGPEGVAVNVDVLKGLVGDNTVSDVDEKFGLNWHGKRKARQLALTPSTGTLLPCPEESVDWDSTQNLMIEGDNLEVLKLLQKSYAGKVKLIYIDPPYNTGRDFVYQDEFKDNIGSYLEATEQKIGTERLSTNVEVGGRFHTNWLNMMYPRILAARSLLHSSGVICISIDDTEKSNLQKLCDEIFGEENHVATIVWQKRYVSNVTAKLLSDMHDFILIYAKDRDQVEVNSWERTEKQLEAYKNPDNDPRGVWRAQDLSASKPYLAGQFPITGPTGLIFTPPPNRYWRCNEQQFNDWKADGRIWWGVSGDARPMLKSFLEESERGITPHTWWDYDFAGHNKQATLELKELFDGDAPFDTPKPVKLMHRIIQLFISQNDLVMDFFAGSGSFAHAALEYSQERQSPIRWINVQHPTPLQEHRFSTISEITKERLRRVIRSLQLKGSAKSADLGFRVFKLARSNIRPWTPQPEQLEAALEFYKNNLIEGRSEQDILYEVLLKLGLDLCVPIETREIANSTVYSVGGGVLTACLTEKFSEPQIESLAEGIANWLEELAPTGDTTCLFRDSAFPNDRGKSNLAAILQQRGVTHVRSL